MAALENRISDDDISTMKNTEKETSPPQNTKDSKERRGASSLTPKQRQEMFDRLYEQTLASLNDLNNHDMTH